MSDGRPVRVAALAVAAAGTGLAVRAHGGTLSGAAIAWLALSLAALAVALVAPAGRGGSRPLWVVASLAAVAGSVATVADPFVAAAAGMLGPAGGGVRSAWWALTGAGAALLVVVCAAPPRASERAFLALVAVQAVAVGWLVARLPMPPLDALMFQRQSWFALAAGRNPYAITFPDPYAPELSARFYGEGISAGGRLRFGYPYLPLTLLLAGPGALLGDVRWASLGAVVASALLVALARPSRASRVAGALIVASPALPLVAVAGWSDPYVLVTVALVHFCRFRAPRVVPIAVGLMLVSKQYAFLAAPAILLLAPRPLAWRSLARFAAISLATGAIVTLPLAAWRWDAFAWSALVLQLRQPFRPDALSLLAWAAPAEPARWIWVCFAAAAAAWAAVFAARRALRPDFALALALVFAWFFATNKQAFANYYFLVVGLAACALAAAGADEEPRAA